VVETVRSSFEGSGSGEVLDTVAEFETLPAAVGFTTTVAVEDVPGASVPTLHVTTRPESVHFAPGFAATKTTLAESVSTMRTPAAGAGPAFVATIV
jgi:hypothetical protein